MAGIADSNFIEDIVPRKSHAVVGTLVAVHIAAIAAVMLPVENTEFRRAANTLPNSSLIFPSWGVGATLTLRSNGDAACGQLAHDGARKSAT